MREPGERRDFAGAAATAVVIVVCALAATMPAGAQARQLHAQGGDARALRSPASPQAASDPETLLVRFRGGVRRPGAEAALQRAGATLGRPVGRTGFSLVRTRGRARDLLRTLESDPRIAEVEPNYRRYALAAPNDPYLSHQPYLDVVRLPSAWDVSIGSATLAVAIVDTGVDLDHPDLSARVLPGADFVDWDGEAWDENGHGTMVAGIAAAVTDNGVGVAGAAWDAAIMPVRVLGAGGWGWDSDVAAGITWAADNGASIVNLSLGGAAASAVLSSAIEYALARDVLVVAAAGNGSSGDPFYPAAEPGVLTVSATDWSGGLAWFSNYGPWVDVAAPGTAIVSTYVADGAAEAYASGAGTSFAAPLVSGAAALVRSAAPFLSQGDAAAALTSSATDLGSPGFDDLYGYGLLDAYAALSYTGAAPADGSAGVPAKDTPPAGS